MASKMAVQDRSEQSIIQDVLGGHKEAYGEIVDRHKSFVYTIAFRVLQNAEDAEEAAQDAFIKAFQALKNFQGQSKFTTWLYRIAFNTAISYKRKRKIEVSGLDFLEDRIEDDTDTMEGIKKEEQRAVIEQGLAELSPIDASIITLFYLKEQNLQEISTISGLKVSAIKVKLFRARKKMADALTKKHAFKAASVL